MLRMDGDQCWNGGLCSLEIEDLRYLDDERVGIYSHVAGGPLACTEVWLFLNTSK